MDTDTNEDFQRAVQAHRAGKLYEAEVHYRKIIDSEPNHADANHNLGVIGVSFGNYIEALPYLQRAIESNPRIEEYWVSCISTLMQLGKIHDARDILSQATRFKFRSDKLNSLAKQLHPSKKLNFFYTYLTEMGIFASETGNVQTGDFEPIPLLTRSFLDWFETQKWNSSKLLELGAGSSTLYFSKFFNQISSYETNENWYKQLAARIPENVKLQKVDNISKSINAIKSKELSQYRAILLDAGENRANLARCLVEKSYQGIIFFDNSEWYRKSIQILVANGFIEIPFFGLKPIEDWVSCTSVIAKPQALPEFFSNSWVSLPKMSHKKLVNPWDEENP